MCFAKLLQKPYELKDFTFPGSLGLGEGMKVVTVVI